jgi:hypothetical protein
LGQSPNGHLSSKSTSRVIQQLGKLWWRTGLKGKVDFFLLKGRKKTGGFDEGRSIISAVTGVSEEADERGKGTSGWTKVKSRGGP